MALIGSRYSDEEFVNRTHRVQPEHTDNYVDTLKADYWKHIARFMKPGDVIRALWEDNSKFAQYLVLAVMEGGVGAKVAALGEPVALVCFDDGIYVDNGTQYKIEHAGNFHKWRVIRLSDGEVVSSQHKTELEARNALHEYRKAMQVNAVTNAA